MDKKQKTATCPKCGEEIVQCENTHGNFRLGPLSRGAGS